MHITFITLSSWWIFFNISTLDPKYRIIVTVNQCAPKQDTHTATFIGLYSKCSFFNQRSKLRALSLRENSSKMTPKIQTTENQYFDSKINLFKCHVPQKYTGGIAIFWLKHHKITRVLFFNPGLFIANPIIPSPVSWVLPAGQASLPSPITALAFSGQESRNFHINQIKYFPIHQIFFWKEEGLNIFMVDSCLDSKFMRLVYTYNSKHVHAYGNPSFLKAYSFVITLHSLSELQAFIYLLLRMLGNKLIQISVHQKDDNR